MSERPLSVTERYYIARYKLNANGKNGEDHCILCHSNRISVITLALSHPVIKDKKTIEKVNYQVTKSINRLENKVTGKGKKGAHAVNSTAPLARLVCTDGSEYTVYACMKGHLIEVNDQLVDNPQLLVDKPLSNGYVGIIISRLQDHKEEMDKLLSQDEYNKLVDTDR